MKDFSKEQLEYSMPNFDAMHLIDFCLSQLYADKIHTIDEDFANGRLTFEELIGTLLVAKDTIIELEKENDEWSKQYYEED